MKRLALWLALLLAWPPEASAWGFGAHRYLSRRAIETLPARLAALFAANADYVAEHSIDPDLWRAAGQAGEDPNHFLDMDAFGAYPFEIPIVEAEHLSKHGADAVSRGRLPWRVAEAYQELVCAFRDRDPPRILARAATLAHYVGDAHVPFHAVLNYDGQLTGQKGLHARWESELFERFERQLDGRIHPSTARAELDPVVLSFEALRESYQASIPALASDRESAGPLDFADTPEDDRYDAGYYSRFYEREGGRLAGRLQQAAQRVGSLWLGAWQEAGQPALPTFRFAYVRRGAKLVLVSLDGSAAPSLDDAVARGLMPNLAAIRKAGTTGRALTSLPAKTPAGHATLFTGAWPDRHGIAGIDMPSPGASIVTARSGFSSEMLTAEPIWVSAARQGLDVAVVSSTQLYPFRPYLEDKRFGGNFGWQLTLFDGYQSRHAASAVFHGSELRMRPAVGWRGALPAHLGPARDFDLTIAGSRVDGLVYDDPADPVSGFDTVYLATDKRVGAGIVLKPREPGNPANFGNLSVRLREGEIGLHFRLFSLSPSGSDLLLYLAEVGILRSNRPLAETAVRKACGGFVGNAADDVYENGGLGLPLWKGGDGTAEQRYLETVRLVTSEFSALMDFGFARTRWDVLIGYLPFPDEFFHLWYGRLDPSLPSYDPALAARLRPFVDQGLQVVDGFLGRIREKSGEAIVAVASDHGQIGVDRIVQFNVALQRAGLLALARDGSIDLFRTKALYFPGNSGYFLVNRTDRDQGIVGPEQEPEVLEKLKTTLRALVDPVTGDPIVTAIFDPKGDLHEPAIGGAHGGDLYVDLAPGYYSSAALRGDLVVSRNARGEHLYGPERASMRAAFAIAGPGVAAGVDLGEIRQIDIAPTLSALLGIEPPAQATGLVLERALAWYVGALTQRGAPDTP